MLTLSGMPVACQPWRQALQTLAAGAAGDGDDVKAVAALRDSSRKNDATGVRFR